jgi:hypothetical protein
VSDAEDKKGSANTEFCFSWDTAVAFCLWQNSVFALAGQLDGYGCSMSGGISTHNQATCRQKKQLYTDAVQQLNLASAPVDAMQLAQLELNEASSQANSHIVTASVCLTHPALLPANSAHCTVISHSMILSHGNVVSELN